MRRQSPTPINCRNNVSANRKRKPQYGPLTGFPEKEPFARAFFAEAARHLEDARILHTAQRYPASITSSMKAAELGMKCVFILDGALGWWDKLFTSHKPFEDAKTHVILSHHAEALFKANAALKAGTQRLERLIPNQPGKQNFDPEKEENPEYPFVSVEFDNQSRRDYVRVNEPRFYFDSDKSKDLYRIAREVLETIQAAHPAVAAW